ncbi:MAG TPA: DUF4097 family beta strand repeat-containing protein [Gemmatimonadaceae bacterium]|nr:DUF4097 family beta strand repeat-containing protein [Gemmatimonadaceae bacterium]
MPASHRIPLRLTLLTALLTLASAPALHAQDRDDEAENRRFLADCDRWGNDRDVRVCDVRELTMAAPGGTLRVDGDRNGGIQVRGWSRNDVRVVARMQAWGRSEAAARRALEEIEIRTGSTIRAEGSDRDDDDQHWAVSFVVYVPQRTDLSLQTLNGGISVENVEGDIALDATNGGLHLTDVAGSVHGETRNGGIDVALSGQRWRGESLDVHTQNGGIQLQLPRDFNADLEIGTVNGGLDIDFPITVQGRIDRQIRTRLGNGGPLVRVTTVNGGVKVERR